MAENTTNINDLPTDPTGGGSISGNISLVANDMSSGQPQNNSGISLDQTTISQIVSGLQQASVAGVTSLPSRDIPRNTEALTQDAQIHPNYVPSPPMNKRDFINEEVDTSFDYKDENTRNTLDSFYDEFQTPLLLAVIYFVFQLPIFKKNVSKYIPFLCNSDGNYNVNGLIVVSGFFGLLYYSLSKMMVSFSRF